MKRKTYSDVLEAMDETADRLEATIRDADSDKQLVIRALGGHRGDDQLRIAEVGLQWVAMLLRKNADYGSSAWEKPILAPECSASAAIRVRMSDKINRIVTLLGNDREPEVAESIDDTLRDLGAYCLLELARPDRTPIAESREENPYLSGEYREQLEQEGLGSANAPIQDYEIKLKPEVHKCVCPSACKGVPCKGRCGCQFCSDQYADYLSNMS